MKRRPWLVACCCLAWAASIFATSSTVITPQVFFAWFHEHVFTDDTIFQNFQLFWGASWLIVVKGWHVTEFAILTLLATWTIDAMTGSQRVRNVAGAVCLSLTYAASDEWHQTFVPQRGGIFSDVLIDSLGVALSGLYLFRGHRNPAT